MKNKILTQNFRTSLGELLLGSFDGQLCLCDWHFRKRRSVIDNRIQKGLKANYEAGESDVLTKTKQQLTEYFEGKRTVFEMPLLFVGTDFQKRVWAELLNIPFGKTMSYLHISQRIGNTPAIRAVAAANGANAIAIIVPCHRVVGSKGELVGYAGGITSKRKLLQLEMQGHTPVQPELFK